MHAQDDLNMRTFRMFEGTFSLNLAHVYNSIACDRKYCTGVPFVISQIYHFMGKPLSC